MNAILDMLNRYAQETAGDYTNALKQIIQEITLLGLWRGKFFEKAAFYGGTAMRIFHGLDRFSEDLDFSLLEPDRNFKLSRYFPYVINELESFGFQVEVRSKDKEEKAIETAFIKAGTLIHFVKIGVPDEVSGRISDGSILKIKLEVDKDPPAEFDTEVKFGLEPVPFSVRIYTLSSLFAGKMHAVLCRPWRSRIKGRDWYDFYWYVKNRTPLNLNHLSRRMQQSGHLEKDLMLDSDSFHKLLAEKISSVDFNSAKEDVVYFIKNQSTVDLWSELFFTEIAKKIVFES